MGASPPRGPPAWGDRDGGRRARRRQPMRPSAPPAVPYRGRGRRVKRLGAAAAAEAATPMPWAQRRATGLAGATTAGRARAAHGWPRPVRRRKGCFTNTLFQCDSRSTYGQGISAHARRRDRTGGAYVQDVRVRTVRAPSFVG